MRALLDINVIIALLDQDHAFHERAHQWWAENMDQGWASCPFTENGVVRIMSNPAYSKKAHFPPGDLILRLRIFADGTDHTFWPDDLSLRDSTVFDAEKIHNSGQITDFYLLALAVKHEGRLATFDASIVLNAIPSAKPANLCAI